MTKQRKMLIGVLCLGLGGLAVDRLVLGAPESALAQSADLAGDVAVPPSAGTVPEALPASEPDVVPDEKGDATDLPSYATLAERLDHARQQQTLAVSVDPFALPVSWRRTIGTPVQPTLDEVSDSARLIIDVITLSGTVRSVIDKDGEKEELLAVITGGGLDDRALRVGQMIRIPTPDGGKQQYRLVEVGPRYVVWEAGMDGERVKMNVASD